METSFSSPTTKPTGPNLAAYKFGEDKCNLILVRLLSAEEADTCTNNMKLLASYQSTFSLFKIIENNYSEWELDLEVNRNKQSMDFGEKALFDRRLMNYLTTTKALIDHYTSLWVRSNRKNGRKDEFRDFLGNLEKNNWSFAFFQDFRNYVQHSGLPVCRYNKHNGKDGNTISIFAEPHVLLKDFNGWAKSKISHNSPDIDLVAELKKYNECMFAEVGHFWANNYGAEIDALDKYFKSLTNEVEVRFPGFEAVYLPNITISEDNQKLNFDLQVIPKDVFKMVGIEVSTNR